MQYAPTRESLAAHRIPAWFDNAKLGIFVHWGLYSVPGWAPLAGEMSEILESGDWAKWFANNPYAEWYGNSYRIEGSPTRRYHQETYGADFAYRDFAPMFNQAVAGWDPGVWADLFAKIHARYVVLTTKHHDGFLLWPSRRPHPFIEGYQVQRDLVGDLSAAVRGRGLTMALYYSGGLDWTFNEKVIQDIADIQAAVPQMPEYVAYTNAHWRELVERYDTKILWNDIAYPAGTDLNVLFAEYYNHTPDGVINNRFTQTFQLGEGNIVSDAHYDFDTPEYAVFSEIREKKWESCRGIGASFGYNRNEGPEQYQTVETLVHMLADVVSKNGNVLLNVGPMADGTIPDLQRERLLGLGAWLDVYGQAIFDTKPWTVAESRTDGGTGVRFTRKDGDLYAIVLGSPVAGPVEIKGLTPTAGGMVRLPGCAGALEWRKTDGGVAVTLPGDVPSAPAYALRISPAPVWQNA